MDVQPGSFITRDGHRAVVREWGEAQAWKHSKWVEVMAWKGVIKGAGQHAWDEKGYSLDGGQDADLVRRPEKRIAWENEPSRKHLTVVGERTVLELRGISCLPLETLAKPRKGIMHARSFGRPLEHLEELEEAVASYTARVAEKLRQQGSVAACIHVFLHTNQFRPEQPQYANEATRVIHFPTAFTPDLIGHAIVLLRGIYREGYRYKKVGVLLSGITPEKHLQCDTPLLGLSQAQGFQEINPGRNNETHSGVSHMGLSVANRGLVCTPWYADIPTGCATRCNSEVKWLERHLSWRSCFHQAGVFLIPCQNTARALHELVETSHTHGHRVGQPVGLSCSVLAQRAITPQTKCTQGL